MLAEFMDRKRTRTALETLRQIHVIFCDFDLWPRDLGFAWHILSTYDGYLYLHIWKSHYAFWNEVYTFSHTQARTHAHIRTGVTLYAPNPFHFNPLYDNTKTRHHGGRATFHPFQMIWTNMVESLNKAQMWTSMLKTLIHVVQMWKM